MREKMNVMVEKKNGKGIGAKRFAVGVLILCLAFSLCACGKKDKYVGTWIGTQGTILVLNKEWKQLLQRIGTSRKHPWGLGSWKTSRSLWKNVWIMRFMRTVEKMQNHYCSKQILPDGTMNYL